MKIIKPGNIDKIKKIKMFHCDFCGCLFEADNTEYKTNSQYNETYYDVICPFCRRRVYKGDN